MQFALDAVLRSRNELGRSHSRRLQKSGRVPCIVYGDKFNEPMSLEHKAVVKALESENFYSSIIELNVNNKKHKVIVKDIQRHPYKAVILHMDFQVINENKPISIHVPFKFINEEIAPGIKIGGGLLDKQLIDIEIKCIPAKIPEFIEVDLSKLELNESVHLSDLKFDENIIIPALQQGNDLAIAAVRGSKNTEADSESEDNSTESSETK